MKKGGNKGGREGVCLRRRENVNYEGDRMETEGACRDVVYISAYYFLLTFFQLYQLLLRSNVY